MIGKKPMLCVFTYEKDGQQKEWTVGCIQPPDNEETMRAHFKQWMEPRGGKLISLAFED